MAAIGAWITTLLGITTATYKLLQAVYGVVATAVQEHIPFFIEQKVRDGYLLLINPFYGLKALADKIDAIGDLSTISADLTAARSDILNALGTTEINILAAVGAPSQAATAPSWWEAPPTPPTPPTTSAIAAAVWQTNSTRFPISADQGTPLQMDDLLEDIWSVASYQVGNLGMTLPLNPYFSVVFANPANLTNGTMDWATLNAYFRHPAPDWSHVLDTDTVLTFLQREEPAFNWQAAGPTGDASADVAWTPYISDFGGSGLRSTFTTLEMHQLAALAPTPEPPTVTVNVAPVWPGIAGATLGDAVALSDGLVVTGPLDGVLIEITGHPAGAGKYGFGEINSWRYLGAILFISDEGQAEWPVQMGPESGLITPRSMKRAAGAVVRLNAAFTGTITPWTITG